MDDKPLGTYRKPDGTMMGKLCEGVVLWSGVIMRSDIHFVDVIQEDENFVLVSCPTFYGWVYRNEVIIEE